MVMETAQTGELALRVVGEIASSGASSIAQLADVLEVSRTAAQRIVATLHHTGILRRVTDGRYDLGLALLALAPGASRAFARSARDIVRQCAATIGTSVVLAVRDGDEAIVAQQAMGPSSSMHVEYVDGYRMSLSRGANGLAILASLPRDHGPRRDSDVDDDVLDAVVRDGYSITESVIRRGMVGVAAPVYNATAGVIGSVAAVAPLVSAPDRLAMGAAVLESAARLSALSDAQHGLRPDVDPGVRQATAAGGSRG